MDHGSRREMDSWRSRQTKGYVVRCIDDTSIVQERNKVLGSIIHQSLGWSCLLLGTVFKVFLKNFRSVITLFLIRFRFFSDVLGQSEVKNRRGRRVQRRVDTSGTQFSNWWKEFGRFYQPVPSSICSSYPSQYELTWPIEMGRFLSYIFRLQWI